MKPALWPIVPMVVTVFFLLKAEFARDTGRIYIWKPISSSLMILIALLAFVTPNLDRGYMIGLLVGLGLSFIGDMLLMFQSQPKPFLVGLVAFLLGHVAYTVTFGLMGGFHIVDLVSLISLVILVILAIVIYRYLKPGLGKMRVPVIVYIIIISLMVNRAVSLWSSTDLSPVQTWMISVGSVLFYVSDVILAIGRFANPFKYYRINLAFYYAGQILIALSASYF